MNGGWRRLGMVAVGILSAVLLAGRGFADCEGDTCGHEKCGHEKCGHEKHCHEGHGSLMVTIDPADAVTDGAQWNVDGGAWQDSGVTVDDLTVGTHTVNYNTIDGWTSPPSVSVTISKCETTSVIGTYVAELVGFLWQTACRLASV